jgi:protein arginine kinase activator
MKCQRCAKQATLHITEVLPEGGYEEHHLCEDCSKKHLYAVQAGKSAKANATDTSDNPSTLCKVCGIKFTEFRKTGRLGCPHDYDEFHDELTLLLTSIHGLDHHTGKAPQNLPRVKQDLADLMELRKQLQLAVAQEAYEEAARLRDQIRLLEDRR